MYPSNTPGSLSVGIELVGMENYMIWSRAMKVALLGRNKLCFIDGSIVRADYSGDLAKDWDRCNAIVLSWLMGNVHRNLLSGILFRSSTALVWKDLEERFDKVNDSRAYYLHREIATLTQGLSSISEYFSRMKDLWDEYDSLVPPSCDCAKSRDSLVNFERQRLYQFLMGLNDHYGHARSQILMMKPMPNINQVYVILMQDESQKQLAGGTYILMDKVDPTTLLAARNGGQNQKKPIL
ncbi:uncharacterized protein LOC107770264 [Nicotiana tabacum]|uniref:Uncharacterized protein LOC107770264 n=1 Tax=Nicotiana tabacum TaxID=4097 RepID=A0A1S3XYL9_TOBAC|nr:PREDICTED: uncharacterized protein LOC107770264 [Nicotiana tabacum]